MSTPSPSSSAPGRLACEGRSWRPVLKLVGLRAPAVLLRAGELAEGEFARINGLGRRLLEVLAAGGALPSVELGLLSTDDTAAPGVAPVATARRRST